MRISDWSSDVCSSDLQHVACARYRNIQCFERIGTIIKGTRDSSRMNDVIEWSSVFVRLNDVVTDKGHIPVLIVGNLARRYKVIESDDLDRFAENPLVQTSEELDEIMPEKYSAPRYQRFGREL